MKAAPSFTAPVLGLLHPRGHAERVKVIGRGCSSADNLCPDPIGGEPGRADLVVLAPSAAELSTPGWLEHAVEEADAHLSDEGILYILSARSSRRRLRSLLKQCGAHVSGTVLHHPNWTDATTLIPLERAPLAYAFTRLIRTSPPRRRLALALLRLPGALALTSALLPEVGLVVRRRAAQPPAKWFYDLAETEGAVGGVVVSASWRGPTGAVLLIAVDRNEGKARAIAKTWLSGEGATVAEQESAGLAEIAVRAAESGVRVPRLLATGALGAQPYLAESAVEGQKVALLLQGRPQLFEEVLARLSEWLEAWNAATARRRVLTEDLLNRLLLQPVAEVLPALAVYDGYQRDLQALADRLLGEEMPLVATHGDLTMANIMMVPEKTLGVIDWETANPDDLPLSDFFYAAVDAAAAVEDYRDRLGAFDACFNPDGRHRSLVARLEARFVEKLRLTPDQVALSFHASWLGHAIAKRHEVDKTSQTEFLHLAQRAATLGFGWES